MQTNIKELIEDYRNVVAIVTAREMMMLPYKEESISIGNYYLTCDCRLDYHGKVKAVVYRAYSLASAPLLEARATQISLEEFVTIASQYDDEFREEQAEDKAYIEACETVGPNSEEFYGLKEMLVNKYMNRAS